MNDDVLSVAERWLSQGHGVALATVISTWGSAPRQTGSLLAIRDDGVFAGSVSNGCIEGAVIEAGLEVLKNKIIRHLEFGVDDSVAWSAGLTCGGQIAVLVEALADDGTITRLNAARNLALPMVRAIHLDSGRTCLIDPATDNSALGLAAREAARHGRSQKSALENGWFLTVFNPPVDLVIIGAVHIAQPLTQMAALLGFNTRVIDPRSAFATTERFPGIPLFPDFPDVVLAKSPLRPHSAVVALSHDPKIDDPALVAALASPAFYIGALGSQKTQASRQVRMKAQGFSETDLDRIHGPIGLAIGSKSPAEIAVSILAEITKTLRLPPQ